MANCEAIGIDPEWYLAEAIRRLHPGATPEHATALTPARLVPVLRAERLAHEPTVDQAAAARSAGAPAALKSTAGGPGKNSA